MRYWHIADHKHQWQREVTQSASLDGIYQQAEANWRSWRAAHPDVRLVAPFDPPYNDADRNAGLVEATRDLARDDDAVLRRFAADPLVWETVIDDRGESPKHAVQMAIEQIVGIRLDHMVQSGELS